METWFMDLLKQYGPFITLVAYVLWDGRNREQRYIGIIDKLADNISEIKKDIATIKTKMGRDRP